MPLLAAGRPTCRAWAARNASTGRSSHPLSFATLPGHAGALYRMPPPLLNVSPVVTQDRHPQPVHEASQRVRAKPSALQALSWRISFILHRSKELCHFPVCRNFRHIDVSITKKAASGKEAAGSSNGQSLASLKKTPQRESSHRLSVAHTWEQLLSGQRLVQRPSTETVPDTQHDNKSRAILRPNKNRKTSATSCPFMGCPVQISETCHSQAPYFGIRRDSSRVSFDPSQARTYNRTCSGSPLAPCR